MAGAGDWNEYVFDDLVQWKHQAVDSEETSAVSQSVVVDIIPTNLISKVCTWDIRLSRWHFDENFCYDDMWKC